MKILNWDFCFLSFYLLTLGAHQTCSEKLNQNQCLFYVLKVVQKSCLINLDFSWHCFCTNKSAGGALHIHTHALCRRRIKPPEHECVWVWEAELNPLSSRRNVRPPFARLSDSKIVPPPVCLFWFRAEGSRPRSLPLRCLSASVPLRKRIDI